jgi:hypothetical protein
MACWRLGRRRLREKWRARSEPSENSRARQRGLWESGTLGTRVCVLEARK